MKTLITLISFVMLSSCAMAQNNNISISFEVEGKQQDYKNATAEFIYNNDTLSSKIENGKLTIPATVVKKKATVIFYIDKYVLKFSSIPVTWNDLNPKWAVGVDTPPFDKEKFWTIKSWKKVEIVYYLKNEDGRMFTVDNCRKSKVITK
ncbi:MAG: hypothetical protein JST17_00040 [Bacteroidetes bacterium]|nr:hypothetical protein [Bacteroidota bacterium]